MRGQPAKGEIQRNNYHHGSCGPSLTGKTSSVPLIFTQGMHRNVENRCVRSALTEHFKIRATHCPLQTMRELVCNGQVWARAVLRQLQGGTSI